MNEPIFEHRPRHFHNDELLHGTNRQRISVGFENACYFPSIDAGIPSKQPIDDETRNGRIKAAYREDDPFGTDSSIYQANVERLNTRSTSHTDALVFDGNSAAATKPTFSTMFNAEGLVQGPFAKASKKGCNQVEQSTPGFDLSKCRNGYKNFALAMEKSTQSQQSIHKWDRMMGLKRSHSKTMRLSMRSRSKLKKIYMSHATSQHIELFELLL
eukprot:jgi/Psemu1/4000/gm1.4000_g